MSPDSLNYLDQQLGPHPITNRAGTMVVTHMTVGWWDVGWLCKETGSARLAADHCGLEDRKEYIQSMKDPFFA